MSRSYRRFGGLGLALAGATLALVACQDITLELQHDREVVKAARAKLMADEASGNAQAVAVDAKSLRWAQSTLAYDAGGNWQPYAERDYHNGHGGGGGHGRSP